VFSVQGESVTIVMECAAGTGTLRLLERNLWRRSLGQKLTL